jgi:hypothetical protein
LVSLFDGVVKGFATIVSCIILIVSLSRNMRRRQSRGKAIAQVCNHQRGIYVRKHQVKQRKALRERNHFKEWLDALFQENPVVKKIVGLVVGMPPKRKEKPNIW